MRFDSTTYLMNALRNNLGFNAQLIENCLRMLKGFIITPYSIRMDETTGIMSLIISLPKSEFEFYEAKISLKNLEISASSRLNPLLSFRMETSVYALSYKYSLCLNDGSQLAGIYYFDSQGGTKDENRQLGLLSFYDKETLSRLNRYSNDKNLTIEEVVGLTPKFINSLGYLSDNDLETYVELRSFKEKAERINSKLTSLNSRTIEEEMLKVYTETGITNIPISCPPIENITKL